MSSGSNGARLAVCDALFSRKGGFVFITIHNVQARTPLRNFVAVLDAMREFNGAK